MKISEILLKKGNDNDKHIREDIAKRCAELTERLNDIRATFDFVTDEQAIDALIYEETATLCRLEQLYREAKSEGVAVEIYERGKN